VGVWNEIKRVNKNTMRSIQLLFFGLSIVSTFCFSQIEYPDSLLIVDFKKNQKINKLWKKDIQNRSTPIASLTSSDFNDLRFLKELIEPFDYVFMGESSHYIGEFNSLRVRLIKYMHENLGYNVVAFESPFSNLEFISENRGILDKKKMLEMGLYSVWNTEELLELMDYLKTHPQLKIIGFDCQEGNLDTLVSRKYFNQLNAIDSSFGFDYEKIIHSFKIQMDEKPYNQTESFFIKNDSLIRELNRLSENIITKQPIDFTISFHLQNIKSSIVYWSSLAKSTFPNSMRLRDSIMADNFLQIIRNKYLTEKVIIWGHNAHISKVSLDSNYPTPMAAYLSSEIKTYNIGMYAYSGSYGKQPIKIKKPRIKNIETFLHENQMKYAFVNLRLQPSCEWLISNFQSLNVGHGEMNLIPAKAYDAIIFFDKVNKSKYLN